MVHSLERRHALLRRAGPHLGAAGVSSRPGPWPAISSWAASSSTSSSPGSIAATWAWPTSPASRPSNAASSSARIAKGPTPATSKPATAASATSSSSSSSCNCSTAATCRPCAPATRWRRSPSWRTCGCLTHQERTLLEENYSFLRKIEHRLQIMFDLQTHLLPDRPERDAQAGHPHGLLATRPQRDGAGGFRGRLPAEDGAEPQDPRPPAARRLRRRRPDRARESTWCSIPIRRPSGSQKCWAATASATCRRPTRT